MRLVGKDGETQVCKQHHVMGSAFEEEIDIEIRRYARELSSFSAVAVGLVSVAAATLDPSSLVCLLLLLLGRSGPFLGNLESFVHVRERSSVHLQVGWQEVGRHGRRRRLTGRWWGWQPDVRDGEVRRRWDRGILDLDRSGGRGGLEDGRRVLRRKRVRVSDRSRLGDEGLADDRSGRSG